MKTLFIPVKANTEINSENITKLKLPKNLAIAYSIQYREIAEKIKNLLSKKHNIYSFTQVLGCSRPKFSKDAEAILLISSGRFHAVSLAFESGIPVYVLEKDQLKKIPKEEIEKITKRQKASFVKFLTSDKIGILISTKPGQENFEKSSNLKSKLKDKKSYLFICNEININQFENFPDIQSWVNTACPRLDFDSSIINLSQIK